MVRYLTGLLLVNAFLCVGCSSEFFRAETELTSTGRIQRKILQTSSRVPSTAEMDPGWTSKQTVTLSGMRETWNGSIADLLGPSKASSPSPRQSTQKSDRYFVASGEFDDIKKIPDYLDLSDPKFKDGPQPRLVRTLTQKDHGFLTEWAWEETLTDVISLQDQRVAREELAALGATLMTEICREAWGPEYDIQGLEAWMRKDLTQFFQESCDLLLEAHLSRESVDIDLKSQVRFAKMLETHGITLPAGIDSAHWDEQHLKQQLEKFVRQLIAGTVHHKNGQPLSKDLTDDLINSLFPQPQTDGRPMTITRLQSATGVILRKKYGPGDDYSDRFSDEVHRLGRRIWGAHLWPFIGIPRHFDYRLTVPGVIIETNGEITADKQIRWRFQANEAYPLGYQMRVRYLTVKDQVGKLAVRSKLGDRAQIVRLFDFLKEDEQLRIALQAWYREGKPDTFTSWSQTPPGSSLHTPGTADRDVTGEMVDLERKRLTRQILGLDPWNSPAN